MSCCSDGTPEPLSTTTKQKRCTLIYRMGRGCQLLLSVSIAEAGAIWLKHGKIGSCAKAILKGRRDPASAPLNHFNVRIGEEDKTVTWISMYFRSLSGKAAKLTTCFSAQQIEHRNKSFAMTWHQSTRNCVIVAIYQTDRIPVNAC